MIQEAIIAAMEEQGLTAYATEKRADIPLGTLKRFLNGETDMKASNLERVLRALGLDIGYPVD